MPRPIELYNTYRNLDVPLANGLHVYGLDVHEYRWARGYWTRAPGDPRNDHDIVDGMGKGWSPLWARIQKAAVKQIGKYGLVVQGKTGLPDVAPDISWAYMEVIDDWRDILYVFEGKGHPRHIQQALRLGHLLGLIGVKGTVEADMKVWCRDYIGLDCNGFVGNYTRDWGVLIPDLKALRDLPNTLPINFAPVGRRLSRIQDLHANDILVWTDGQHIAIIDKVESIATDGKGTPTALVWVCESTGSSSLEGDKHTDGLNYTQYAVTAVNGDVFTVYRAGGWERAGKWDDKLQHQSKAMHVYISRLM
jgi:hypothetical protein